MSGLAAGLARGLAMYGQGRMIAEDREAERQRQEAERQRQMAMMKLQQEQFALQREQFEAGQRQTALANKRVAETDTNEAIGKGFRPVGDPWDTFNDMVGIDPSKAETITVNGQPMRKVAPTQAFQQGIIAKRDAENELQRQAAAQAAQLADAQAQLNKIRPGLGSMARDMKSAQALLTKYGEQMIAPKPVGGGGAGGGPVGPNGLPPIDTNELMKWRGEFAKQTGNEKGIAEGYSRLRAATAKGLDKMTPADDIGLIYGFMKMQDPGSTVREGEYATAEKATGVDGRILQLYNKVIAGEKLTPAMRAQFMGTADQSAREADNRVRRVATDMVPLMTRRGIDPSEVITAPFSGLLRQNAGPAAAPRGAAKPAPNVNNDKGTAFPDYETWKRQKAGG